jgi:hypothetical protein
MLQSWLNQVKFDSLHVLAQEDWTTGELLSLLDQLGQKYQWDEMTTVWRFFPSANLWYQTPPEEIFPQRDRVLMTKVVSAKVKVVDAANPVTIPAIEVAAIWPESIFGIAFNGQQEGDFGVVEDVTATVLFLTPKYVRVFVKTEDKTILEGLTQLTLE